MPRIGSTVENTTSVKTTACMAHADVTAASAATMLRGQRKR